MPGTSRRFVNCLAKTICVFPALQYSGLRLNCRSVKVILMPKPKPTSSTLMDLEWARVYADRIREELKLIGKTLSDLNAHAMHPHLVKGAVLLKAQMKEASQQVGGMRKIASQYESSWMNTIKRALERKYPGFSDGKSTPAKTSRKKPAKSKSRASRQS